MRIALATEFLPSSDAGEITGGVEAYCHFVGRELQKDHDVVIIARRTTGASLDTARLGSLLGRIAFAARSVAATWRADPDIAVGTNYVTHPVAWLAGRLRGCQVVYWYPDVLIGTWRSGAFGRTGWIFELLERAVLALRADHYIAISATVANKLAAQGIDRSRISIIPCGYDRDEVARAAAGTRSVPGRVSVVGRLVPYKRVDLVIEAMAILRDRGDAVSATIVGQGAESGSLHSAAAALGLADDVHFEGHVRSHEDVLRAIAASSVFVCASEVEGFGIVVAEAMGLGVPAVVSDIEVFQEITEDGHGATLFRAGDAGDLADKIAALLDDEGARAAQIQRGHEVSVRYRWDAIAAETAAVFRDVVDESGGTRRGRRPYRIEHAASMAARADRANSAGPGHSI